MASLGDSTALDEAADAEDEPFLNRDVIKLLSRWRNEKYAPEVLPFDGEVVENLSEVVEFVSETLEDERAEEIQDPNDPDCSLRRMDLERVKYVLRDYLRIRLWKLSQWPQHYLEPNNLRFLSDAERLWLREFWDVKKEFLDHRLLKALPLPKQGLSDTIDLLDMVRRPALDKHVYARILGDVGPVEIPPSFTQDSSGSLPEPLNLIEGRTYLLRYSLVRKFLTDLERPDLVQLV
mmetsp:Transcript_60183/g.130518  ORF Transcript_60183/g.130518 Transcript_60183/m.130518 type:complete len:235 (+) Transcript_60183:58-762(+)